MKLPHIKYASLTRELVATEFKLKYQGSVIGYLWSLMKPLAIFGVLYLVFTVFVKIGSGMKHYPIYLLLGIVLWSYFSESTNAAMRSIVDKGDLIRKVYFPRIIIIIASSISALITLGINLIIIAIFLLWGHVWPHVAMLYFPLLIIEFYLLSLGVSLFLSALYVKFRDFIYIWEVILQMLFYASAILFPLSIVPAKYTKFILLSPITQVIQDARNVLISSSITTSSSILHMPYVLIPYVAPIILVIAGYWFFEKSAAKFAEDV